MKLVIANKNYSSWSMRPWVLMRHFGIAFDEVKLRFGATPDAPFHRELARFTPAGRVPVLVDDDGFAVWDSLAIVETLAEGHPQAAIWPADPRRRARARSLCAEMHAGFAALRRHCPQNLEAQLPEVGPRVLAEHPAVRADLDRILAMWSDALDASGGPFLFGGFGAADAYYAPVGGRIRTYGLPVPPAVEAYVGRVFGTPAIAAWVADALAERDFLAAGEPYRPARDR